MTLYLDGVELEECYLDGTRLDTLSIDGVNVFTRFNPNIGDFVEGGYFAGYMNYNSKTYAIIVAEASSGESLKSYRTSNTASTTKSYYDGYQNTYGESDPSSHLAIAWAKALNINGYTDWYIPAAYELMLIYKNLKPTTNNNNTNNVTSFGIGCGTVSAGANPYSDPVTPAYTSTVPTKTTVNAFQDPSGAERFQSAYYGTSTENCALNTNYESFRFTNGFRSLPSKTDQLRVRAIRRVEV